MEFFINLHLMYAEVTRVLVSSGTQAQPQVILNPDYLPDYLSVSYDYGLTQSLPSVVAISLVEMEI